MRVIFFAMPLDMRQRPKTIADKESDEARWVTLEELKLLSLKPPGLRGPELFDWGIYVENGGLIAPLSFLSREEDQLRPPTQEATAAEIPAVCMPGPADAMTPEETLRKFTEAIEHNDDATVRKLLLGGYDPNTVINTKMWTGLHYAIKCNHDNVVSALLVGGAELTLSTLNKRNCLHFAAQSTISILSMLLIKLQVLPAGKRSETINAQDVKGETPLHFAAKVFAKSRP
jgi:ankyrin repeat protein